MYSGGVAHAVLETRDYQFLWFIQSDVWLQGSSSFFLLFDSFFFQAEDGIRDSSVTGVQTCALPICLGPQAGHALIFLAALAAVVQGLAQAAGVVLAVAARLDPGIAHARQAAAHVDGHGRSEERRVGEECRSRWSPDH